MTVNDATLNQSASANRSHRIATRARRPGGVSVMRATPLDRRTRRRAAYGTSIKGSGTRYRLCRPHRSEAVEDQLQVAPRGCPLGVGRLPPEAVGLRRGDHDAAV